MRRYFAAATTALFLLGSSSALAARVDEPVKLTDQELDEVIAGDRFIITINFVLEDVYNSPINTALVLQISGSGSASQTGTAQAIQSVLATPAGSGGAGAQGAQRAQANVPAHAARPAHAGR